MRGPAGPRIDLDQPAPGTDVAETLEVLGWAFASDAAIESVVAILGAQPPVPLAYGQERPDVAAVHGCRLACGFHGRLPVVSLPAGATTLRIEATDTRGRRVVRRVGVNCAAPAGERSEESPTLSRAAGGHPVAPSPPRAPTLAPAAPAALAELKELLAVLREKAGHDPSLLDASGGGLADCLPGELVVAPLVAGRWPWAEASFDVVVIGSAEPGDETAARRVARRAVARWIEGRAVEWIWRAPASPRRATRVSVVIPVFNQSACTEACLERVFETWPASVDGEVVVVDDGSSDDTPELLARWSARESRLRPVRRPRNEGFVAACNAGAAAATGDVLVFLNNDTLPLPGWLPPLVATLERDGAGAVGGKLLYPDLRLQEAGGVVFSDGDACNFGRGGDPADPLYDHVREVDYCSGALLATPRALFLELGGFDSAYAPAYYEDTDYAFRLRECGRRVYYQPASAVIHLEGATAGRDVASGVKQQQVVNRGTFAKRWARELRAQPAHPRALDRRALHGLHVRGSGARRALVILPTMPELDRESGSRRAFHLIELLVQAGCGVSVVVENPDRGERYGRALRQLGAAVYAWPHEDPVARVSELVARAPFEVALIAFWHVAERHLLALRALSPRTRVLIDSVDLHLLRHARAGFARRSSSRQPDALDERFGDEARRELNAYGAADAVLTVSSKEAAWIDDLVGTSGHALCVPDLEDARGPLRPLAGRRGVVFLGNFRHPPNVDALSSLADVLDGLAPGLLDEHPVAIVGNALELSMLGPLATRRGVEVVGWVPSVEPYLERARVCLVPLRHGAGTKRKVLQALLAGTPCVSTPVGTEGLDLEHERDVLVASGPGPLAAAVTRLLSDDDLWLRLSSQGRSIVEHSHGRETVRGRFLAALDAVLAR
jgi:GT2 family glycosyltransferase